MALPSVIVAAALAFVGCGLQPSARGGPVLVSVTRDFGARLLCSATVRPAPAGVTAVGLYERACKVRAGPATTGSARWSVYVNGVAASARARASAGGRVWWDLHPPSPVPAAVVGSFPEPFLHGLYGGRLPTTLECGTGVTAACRRIATALTRLGVPTASQLLGAGSGQDSLTVEVAAWSELRGQVIATLLARGPAASGVFARFTGAELEVLDSSGADGLALGPGAGLIAALGQRQAAPTWLVTGTNAAGVLAAAKVFGAQSLRDRYALAVSSGRAVALPR